MVSYGLTGGHRAKAGAKMSSDGRQRVDGGHTHHNGQKTVLESELELRRSDRANRGQMPGYLNEYVLNTAPGARSLNWLDTYAKKPRENRGSLQTSHRNTNENDQFVSESLGRLNISRVSALELGASINLESGEVRNNPPPMNIHPAPTLRDISDRNSSRHSMASSSRSSLRQSEMDRLAEGLQERTRMRNEIVKILNENVQDSAAIDAKLASFAEEKGQRSLEDSQSNCRVWLEKVHQQERVEGQQGKNIEVINKFPSIGVSLVAKGQQNQVGQAVPTALSKPQTRLRSDAATEPTKTVLEQQARVVQGNFNTQTYTIAPHMGGGERLPPTMIAHRESDSKPPAGAIREAGHVDHRSVGLNNIDLAILSSQNNGIGQQVTAENWQADLVEENRDQNSRRVSPNWGENYGNWLSDKAPCLPFFDGTPERWLNFQAAVMEASEWHTQRSLIAGIRSKLTEEAGRYAGNSFILGESVTQLMDRLEEQFARPDYIIRALINRVRMQSIPEPNSRNSSEYLAALVSYATSVNDLILSLAVKNGSPLDSFELLTEIPARLPKSSQIPAENRPLLELHR